MQKNKKDKKPLTDVERYQNKMRVIGGIICLVALITAFVVGLFVGKAVERGSTAKDTAVVDTVLTADATYTLSGKWTGNSVIDIPTLYSICLNDMIDIAFTSGGETFNGMTGYQGVSNAGDFVYSLRYHSSDGVTLAVYYTHKGFWGYSQYKTIEIVGTYTTTESFYNWFTSNYTPEGVSIEEYTVTYELINGVDSPYSNPTIVDNLSTYEILFFSMIGDGDYDYGNNIYLAQNMTVTMTNCTYERIYVDDFIVRYSISEVVGDVVITATNNRLEKYTEVRKVGSVYEYDIAISDFDNCFLVNNEILGYSYYVIAPLPDTADQSYSFSITVTFLDVETQKLYTGFESSSVGVTIATPEYPDTYTMKTTVVIGTDGQSVKTVLVNMRLMSSVDDIDPSVAVSFVDWLVVAIGAFFSFSIIPGLSFGLVFGVLMIVMVVRWILNIFAGG